MNKNQSYRDNIDKSKNLYNLNKCLSLLNNKDKLKKIGEGYVSNVFYANSFECGSIVLKIHKNINDKALYGFNQSPTLLSMSMAVDLS